MRACMLTNNVNNTIATSRLVASLRSCSPAPGAGSCDKRQARCRLVMAVVLALAALFPAACRPGEEGLHFETIEREVASFSGMYWEAREPGLMILTSWNELGSREKLFTVKGQAYLESLDWQSFFVVAAFLGYQGSSTPTIEIDRIVRRGSQVLVLAQVLRVPDTVPVTGEATSPYHLVEVEKEGEWGQDIVFSLYLDGKPVASESHLIP